MPHLGEALSHLRLHMGSQIFSRNICMVLIVYLTPLSAYMWIPLLVSTAGYHCGMVCLCPESLLALLVWVKVSTSPKKLGSLHTNSSRDYQNSVTSFLSIRVIQTRQMSKCSTIIIFWGCFLCIWKIFRLFMCCIIWCYNVYWLSLGRGIKMSHFINCALSSFHIIIISFCVLSTISSTLSFQPTLCFCLRWPS